MQFTCDINDDKSDLQFNLAHKDSKLNLNKSRCLKYGINKITEYLNKFDLFIRPFYNSDLKYLSNNSKIQDGLCGDMDIMPILNEMNDYLQKATTGINLSDYKLDNGGVRITYVLCHTSKPKVILGFLSSVLNYNEPSFREGHSIDGLYKKLEQMDTLYIELGCSSIKYSQIVTGTNYFVRAYILLVTLKNTNIKILWGQVSGDVRGSRDKLFDLHKQRSCLRYDKSDFYTCDVFTFLNEFFRRLNTNELLRYTIKHSKK